MRQTDLKKTAAKNKKVDVKQLGTVFETLRELARSGVAGPGYNLATPFSNRNVRIADSDIKDKNPSRIRYTRR